jgi:threonine/homoserine/homoserine lactone efflux protein
MPEPATLLLFALAALALVAVPGPNLIYIATRSLGEGRRAGVASALGVETGTLVHVTAAVVGLSALIASSATAFEVVRYAGAAYLVILGVRALLRRQEHDLILGLILCALGCVMDVTYALAAGALGGWLRRRPGFVRRQGYFTGSVYIALGVAAALAGGGRRRD